jgi:hypothetical protein
MEESPFTGGGREKDRHTLQAFFILIVLNIHRKDGNLTRKVILQSPLFISVKSGHDYEIR